MISVWGHLRMSLRAIAVSAPEYPFGRRSTGFLNSQDPISLYNACRYSAFLASIGLGPWGESNWAVPRKDLTGKFLLMNSLMEEKYLLEEMLEKERPNLLLIGSMTMCFPGAIECAKIAKRMFGDDIYIVLGGRHITETIYTNIDSCVLHHPGSPLKLIAENVIDNVFDLVISGEGEFIITKIGEIISELERENVPAKKISLFILNKGILNIPGKWIAGFVNDNKIYTAISRNNPIDQDLLPSPVKIFGVNTAFDIFENSMTGHAFSGLSPGCIYDCGFCSERRSVCGSLMQVETSATRLFRQLKDICEVIKEDCPGKKASAFIEDSILLGGIAHQLKKLNTLLSDYPLDIKFGGQLTIDIAIKHKNIVEELAKNGLDYIFVGMEIIDPTVVGGINKDIGKNKWIDRFEWMMEEYTDIGVKIGLSILFGLGENQHHRKALIKRVYQWKQNYGNPLVLSFNWAVQHPLKGNDNGTGYNYINWAIEKPEYIEAFSDFGEASVNYCVPGAKPPSLDDLLEIKKLRKKLSY